MTERAEVLEVRDGIATVRCAADESCASCSSLFCAPRSRTYSALLTPDESPDAVPLPVRPGHWVEVEVPERGALGKGVLLLGVPLVLFVAVYLGLGSTGSEVIRVAGGFGGLAGGLWAAVLVSRAWKEPMPRIVQIYHEPRLEPADYPVSSYP